MKFLRLKWPNDRVGGAEKKLAGHPAGSRSGGPANRLAIVVGIGTKPWVAAPRGATPTPRRPPSLAALGIHIGARGIVRRACQTPGRNSGPFGTMVAAFGEIRRRWLERASGLGQPVAIRTGNATVEGTFDTIDETGCMMVRTSGGKTGPESRPGTSILAQPPPQGGQA